jgi:hypothetical protein
MNWLVTLLATPRQLPRMDFAKAIPLESRTLVVITTMLTSYRGIERLIKGLEVRYLANPLDNQQMLTDSTTLVNNTIEDEPLLQLAAAGIVE